MKKLIFLLSLLVLVASLPARSDDPPAPPPASPSSQAIIYELRDLVPAGITQYSSASETVFRQYLEFRNGQGTHNIIYEEVSGPAPLRNIAALREIARAWDSSCAIDIECSSKAFCTGECRNMYYETSNAPGDNISPDRNKCKVTYFSCEPKAAVPAAPVTAQFPAPPASP